MHLLDKAGLENLEQRLRDGKGPDRKLDLSLDLAFIRDDEHDKLLNAHPDKARHFTGSIDAAQSLGRRISRLNLPETSDAVVKALPTGLSNADFVPLYARAFCLEVLKVVKTRYVARVDINPKA